MEKLRLLGLIGTAIAAIQPVPRPSALVEHVEVRLVMLDVLVFDGKGNPVPGLRAEDFDVEVDRRPVPLVSLDDACHNEIQKPNIILAFDYQHLDKAQRGRILDDVRGAFERGAGGPAAVMVVALTGGLRVEQPFTKDRRRVQTALARMQNDVELWAGNFSHRNEDGFVRGLTSLFDVAGTFSGPTAVILYSGMRAVPLEEQFRELAAQASAARCAVYPVSVLGLSSGPRATERGTTLLQGDNRTAPPLTLSDDEGGPASSARNSDRTDQDGIERSPEPKAG